MPSKLAVINNQGEVWARKVTGSTVSAGVKLSGPGLFGGPGDKYVIGLRDNIAVITEQGEVWNRSVTESKVRDGFDFGNIFGGPGDKYVLSDGSRCIFVVNTDGEVWGHDLGDRTVGAGFKLDGPGLFGGPGDKYVVYDDFKKRFLVINTDGEVWGHDLTNTTLGGGYKLDGPGLFGGPGDISVVYLDEQLLVINTEGEVWARKITGSTVGTGFKLDGPGLFGGPGNKYVIGYHLSKSHIEVEFVRLACQKTEDSTGADSVYLNYNGIRIFGGTDINDGQSINLNIVRQINGTAQVDLFDDDFFDPDDFLGSITISEDELNTGLRSQDFTRNGANYTLFYRVREND